MLLILLLINRKRNRLRHLKGHGKRYLVKQSFCRKKNTFSVLGQQLYLRDIYFAHYCMRSGFIGL